jgi:alginate O-acetyltransferase complex protein AlgI
VAWGGLHGLYLWIEKFFQDRKKAVSRRTGGVLAGWEQIGVAYGGVAQGGAAPVMAKLAIDRPGIFNTRWSGFPYALFTFFLVNMTWVFFRASTFGQAGAILGSMFGLVHGGAPILATLAMLKIGVILSLLVLLHWLMRDTKIVDVAYRLPWWVTGLIWSAMLILVILSQASSGSFIYFQF